MRAGLDTYTCDSDNGYVVRAQRDYRITPGFPSGLLAYFDFGQTPYYKFPVYGALDVLTTVRTMAFRGSGVTGTYLPVQSNSLGTAGDVLSYGRGTQVSGNNYDCANTNQGTTLRYFEPMYKGNDGLTHAIAYGGISVQYKSSASQYSAYLGNVSTVVSTTGGTVAAWDLLSKHLSVVRYDADNVIAGTRYADLTLDGAVTNGPTSAISVSAPGATNYIGSANAVGAWAGHLNCFDWTFDDLWSDADLALVYGAGTVVSPDRVMKNPECLKMLWAPGLRAASGSVAGATANEGCFWNKRLYNSGTNPYGNLVVNGDFETSLGAEWTASATATLTKSTTTAHLVGMFDTSVLTVTNNAGPDGTATQTISGLSAGDSVYVSVWAANVDSDAAVVNVTSGVSLFLTASNATTTSTKYSACGVVPAGSTTVVIELMSDGADGKIARFDNVDVHVNKVANGGMEGTYVKTGSAIHTSTAATTTYSATRATDSTAWTLTNAVLGMIVEGDGGKYGFITAIGANYVDVAAWVGGTPTNGQAANVYSALAPGWTLAGAARAYRATGRNGSYAQGFTNSAAIADGIRQTLTLANTTWHSTQFFGRLASGAGTLISLYGNGWVGSGVSTTSATFASVTGIYRTSATSSVQYFYGSDASGKFEIDDLAVIPLSSVTLTATAGGRSETNGTNEFGGDTNSIPSAGVLSLVGSVVGTFTPRGWDGADGREHIFFDTTAVSNSRILIRKTTTGTIHVVIYDSANATKYKILNTSAALFPNNTLVRWGVSWDAAGTLVGHVNGTALDTNAGAGTGIMSNLPTPLFIGSSPTGTNEIDATDHKLQFFNTAMTVNQLIGAANAL